MIKKTIVSVNLNGIVAGLLVFTLGIYISFFAFFCFGPVVGIPLCVLSLFMGYTMKKILKCEDCGGIVDRA